MLGTGVVLLTLFIVVVGVDVPSVVVVVEVVVDVRLPIISVFVTSVLVNS